MARLTCTAHVCFWSRVRDDLQDREALRATMQAGGGAGGRVGTRVATGGRQFTVLLNPLIELLTQRAAE